MVDAPPSSDDLRAEARLWLTWARGAGGSWLPAETPAPAMEAALRAIAVVEVPPVRRSGRAPQPRAARADPAPPASTPAPSPPETPAERDAALERLTSEVAACARCVLAGDRAQTVFGSGSHSPRLVIVGEAPGAEEDRTGQPFVGRAGQLLTKMLSAIGLQREDSVYITNLLKCRPPANRNPRPDEVAACKPFLREQLRLLNPPLILALGSPAARELLQTRRGIMSLRGRFMKTPDGYRVMPSFHPAYLLRNPAAKREAWSDLKKVAEALGLEIPKK